MAWCLFGRDMKNHILGLGLNLSGLLRILSVSSVDPPDRACYLSLKFPTVRGVPFSVFSLTARETAATAL